MNVTLTNQNDSMNVVKSKLNLLNRELGALEFNRRVLALAQNLKIPLLERLKYICIVSSNLDEFFEIRIADRYLA